MIPVELFSNIKSYGRIAIRERSSTIAVGMIKEIKWILLFININNHKN